MTYTVSSGTLNPTQLQLCFHIQTHTHTQVNCVNYWGSYIPFDIWHGLGIIVDCRSGSCRFHYCTAWWLKQKWFQFLWSWRHWIWLCANCLLQQRGHCVLGIVLFSVYSLRATHSLQICITFNFAFSSGAGLLSSDFFKSVLIILL